MCKCFLFDIRVRRLVRMNYNFEWSQLCYNNNLAFFISMGSDVNIHLVFDKWLICKFVTDKLLPIMNNNVLRSSHYRCFIRSWSTFIHFRRTALNTVQKLAIVRYVRNGYRCQINSFFLFISLELLRLIYLDLNDIRIVLNFRGYLQT